MSQVHPNAAGVDIGAHEIMVCVNGTEATQIVRRLAVTPLTCKPLEVAGRTWRRDSCDGKHRSVLDTIIED